MNRDILIDTIEFGKYVCKMTLRLVLQDVEHFVITDKNRQTRLTKQMIHELLIEKMNNC
jgi:hypothetical protein